MEIFGLNIVDVAIVVALFFYILSHAQEGFLVLTRRLLAFVGGVIIAFITYTTLSPYISSATGLTEGVADSASFIAIFFLTQMVISKILKKLLMYLPEELNESKYSKWLATLPALIDGVVLVTLLLLVIVTVPVLPSVRKPIENSKVGTAFLSRAVEVEVYVDQIFGQAAQETLGFLTVHPDADEVLELPFKPSSTRVDEDSENEMLILLNIEREARGIPPLVMDETIVPVARAHSEDMWERSYFAHENPDGLSPFDRMREGGVEFVGAGENLALARTTERAHTGLMNSEGHKRNILDPSFTRVGIGVIDGGIYGKMYTQNFAY